MQTDLDVKLAMNEAREFAGRDVTTICPSDIGYGISLLKKNFFRQRKCSRRL